ncbi:helix-turn-helix domain-containing protein [Brevibacillus dissolubilis]|uniref:helix-turn-helix domain-containing protein n=1 Tax=Brevibacillus dissolubilis TaxID=1844116 RepID=UPI001115D522|nr:helix-turn-helix domain-containing protein [Brevibacillus dissolubilis]
MNTNLSSLVKFYREKKGMSLSQLSKVADSRVSYSTLSRIEKGLTKHPDLETFEYLIEQLNIPQEEAYALYVEQENQTNVLEHLLEKALQTEPEVPGLVYKIVGQLIKSWENSDELDHALYRLYDFAVTYTDLDVETYAGSHTAKRKSIRYISEMDTSEQHASDTYSSKHHTSEIHTKKIAPSETRQTVKYNQKATMLFSIVAEYAKQYGYLRMSAKALLQRYLIERSNVTGLEGSYYYGLRVIEEAGELENADYLLVHYMVGIHAFYLREYRDCLFLLQRIIDGTSSSDPRIVMWKEEAYLAMYNSYLYLGDYDKAEKYLNDYVEIFNRHDAPHIMVDQAMLHARRREFPEAMKLLREYLHHYEDWQDMNTVTAVNELLRVSIKLGLLADMEALLDYEGEFLELLDRQEMKLIIQREYAEYLRLKGQGLVLLGEMEAAVKALFSGMKVFAELKAETEITEMLHELFRMYAQNRKSMDTSELLHITDILDTLKHDKTLLASQN